MKLHGSPVVLAMGFAAAALAQVPADIEAQLVKMGHIVDPACTARRYRPLRPANASPTPAAPLCPGVASARDISFGSNAKDVVGVFAADKGGGKRTVLMYIPG